MKEGFSYEKLTVWQDSIKLVQEIYKLSQQFPRHELYGLTSQLRRAAISIGLNIAEGKGRYYKNEFIKFLYISRGSTYEVATCLEIAKELNYINPESSILIKDLTYKIQSKLNNLINSLKLRPTSSALPSNSRV